MKTHNASPCSPHPWGKIAVEIQADVLELGTLLIEMINPLAGGRESQEYQSSIPSTHVGGLTGT